MLENSIRTCEDAIKMIRVFAQVLTKRGMMNLAFIRKGVTLKNEFERLIKRYKVFPDVNNEDLAIDAADVWHNYAEFTKEYSELPRHKQALMAA